MVVFTAIRLFLFLNTNQLGAQDTDSWYRLLDVKRWFDSPAEEPRHLVWLPLYHLPIIILVKIGFNIVFAGQFVSLVFGILTGIFYFILVKEVFDRKIAILSTLLLAFNSIHFKYSVLSMTETAFIFYLMLAFYFLNMFFKTNEKKYIYFSSLMLVLLSLLRFEGWLYSWIFTLLLYCKIKNLKLAAIYGFFYGLVILWYSWYAYKYTGNFLFGVMNSDKSVMADHFYFGTTHLDLLKSVLSNFLNWKYIFLPLGIVFALLKRNNLHYLFAFLPVLLYIIYKILFMQLHPFDRYFLASLVMLSPYTFCLLKRLLNYSLITFGIILLIISFGINDLILTKTEMNYSEEKFSGEFHSALWMKKNKGRNDKIILDITRTSDSFWTLFSEISEDKIYMPLYASERLGASDYKEPTEENVVNMIISYDYKYIVLKKSHVIYSYLGNQYFLDQLSKKSFKLDEVYNHRDVFVFKIIRQ